MLTEKDGDVVVSAIYENLEKTTKKKVVRVMVIEEEKGSAGDSLPAFVLFTDGSILRADITVFSMFDELAVRVRGNYI